MDIFIVGIQIFLIFALNGRHCLFDSNNLYDCMYNP